MATRLSKSRYLAGLQCPKRLYLEIHARELMGEIDAGTQAILDAGTRVGKLARERVPGGVLFQGSNHIDARGGELRHEAYLCPDAHDPREELAVALLQSVGQVGSICTYSSYERAVLTGLAETLPHLRRDLVRLCARLWDLLPILKVHYYHPAFAGSYSIKAVLPALAPHLAYADLEIQEGTIASVQFSRMVFDDLDPAEQARIRSALLNYCARDTLARVEVRKALRARAIG